MLLPALLLSIVHVQPGDTGVPYRQPQLAAAHGLVAMTFGGGSSIYFTSSSDQGRTFLPPTKVAETGALALGRHRGPRVAILNGAVVITAIAGKKTATGAHAHGLPENGDLMVWRSIDRGKTWTQTGIVNDTDGAAREGLHALAAGPNGSLFAAWLDLRAAGTQLYGSSSKDGGLTWSKNVPIYSSPGGTICQCCHPALSIDETGRVWVMWRNALDGSRDLHITNSADGVHFETAQRLGVGTWKINACPMDGGGFAVEKGLVTSAWRREEDVFLTGPNGEERRVGAGKDVALARAKRGTYVAWTKSGAIELLKPDAAAAEQLTPKGGFATLLTLPDGSVLAAWETGETVETKRID